MSAFPDFSQVPFDDAGGARARAAEPWATPEGVAVKPAYGPEDLEGLAALDGFPGLAPFPPF